MELNPSPQTLVIFVDDTGHEALVRGQPVYGLGGCAVMGGDLDRIVRHPWQEIRRLVTGSPNAALHAATFSRVATPDQIAAVAGFFRSQRFARLGAIITTETTLADEIGIVPTIALVLQRRIADIARWTRLRELAVIFESSQRADRLVEASFQGFKLEERGVAVATECYFMPKSAGEPGLEVADFIMHAIGRQARRNLGNPGFFVPDFRAVFHEIDPKIVSFMQVEAVVTSRDSTG